MEGGGEEREESVRTIRFLAGLVGTVLLNTQRDVGLKQGPGIRAKEAS